MVRSVLAVGLTAAAADGSFAELEQQFRTPPREAGPAAYWDWLDGNADLKTITSDLVEAKAKGMSGLEIWDVGALSNPGGAGARRDAISGGGVRGRHSPRFEGRPTARPEARHDRVQRLECRRSLGHTGLGFEAPLRFHPGCAGTSASGRAAAFPDRPGSMFQKRERVARLLSGCGRDRRAAECGQEHCPTRGRRESN